MGRPAMADEGLTPEEIVDYFYKNIDVVSYGTNLMHLRNHMYFLHIMILKERYAMETNTFQSSKACTG